VCAEQRADYDILSGDNLTGLIALLVYLNDADEFNASSFIKPFLFLNLIHDTSVADKLSGTC